VVFRKMVERASRKNGELDVRARNRLRRCSNRPVSAGNEDALRSGSDRSLYLLLQRRRLDLVEIKTARRRKRVPGLLESS